VGPLLGLPLVLLAQAQAEVLAAELQALREGEGKGRNGQVRGGVEGREGEREGG
jgi:hypothetical protein